MFRLRRGSVLRSLVVDLLVMVTRGQCDRELEPYVGMRMFEERAARK